MIISVAAGNASLKPEVMICSVVESRAAAGSSNIKISGLRNNARAKAIRWRSPAERDCPLARLCF